MWQNDPLYLPYLCSQLTPGMPRYVMVLPVPRCTFCGDLEVGACDLGLLTPSTGLTQEPLAAAKVCRRQNYMAQNRVPPPKCAAAEITWPPIRDFGPILP